MNARLLRFSLALLMVPGTICLLRAQAADPFTDAETPPRPVPGDRPPGSPGIDAREIGTIPNLHCFGRIFLAGQPSLADFETARKQEGVRTVINLRTAAEMEGSEQAATLEKLGIAYHHIPFAAPETLTDEVFDQAVSLVSDRKNHPVMLHCKSANRVGAIWLVHRVINDKRTYEEALAEARVVGLRAAGYEAKAKTYIERYETRQRQRADHLDQLADEWQYPSFTEDFGGGASGSTRSSVQKCEDDFGEVWQFYADKCGFEREFSDQRLYRSVRSEGRTTYLLDDHPRATEESMFRMRTFFVCNTPDYSVSILLLPSGDETPETPVRVYRTITLHGSLTDRLPRTESGDSESEGQ